MSWDGRHPNCVCHKSMGDNEACAMHAEVFKQRKAGCSCWAGWEMLDGTFLDPGCEAEEWHNRKANKMSESVRSPQNNANELNDLRKWELGANAVFTTPGTTVRVTCKTCGHVVKVYHQHGPSSLCEHWEKADDE